MKNRLIILEGPDGTGKTTAAKEISRIYGYIYMRFTWTAALSGAALYDATALAVSNIITNLELNPEIGFVLDRSWISEEVYGPIFRVGKVVDLSFAANALAKYDPVIILRSRPDAVEWQAANPDAKHPYPKRKFSKVVKAYEALAETYRGNIFRKSRFVEWPLGNLCDGPVELAELLGETSKA